MYTRGLLEPTQSKPEKVSPGAVDGFRVSFWRVAETAESDGEDVAAAWILCSKDGLKLLYVVVSRQNVKSGSKGNALNAVL